nr:hypothetical protein [uncultured Draconibacterium sp.]
METQRFYPKWMFVVLPAFAMMLGWGLRGHIGGGPFGAMIPGAFLALSLGLLLKLPASFTSVILVFSVFGVGLGGEMTYGQTLGIIRNPDTFWWGLIGTTLKGAVWGLSAGVFLALGIIYRHVEKRTILWAIVIYIIGMILGFKLINDPMLIYFSDRAKPRTESWAALLFGAVLVLIYLKMNIQSRQFKLIPRFAGFGLVGGGLGFGLGSLWLVLGTYYPDAVFGSWWKAMEFTFGLLLGAALGYATWLSRRDRAFNNWEEDESSSTNYPLWKELGVVTVTALLIYWLLPMGTETLIESSIINNMPGGSVKNEIARMLVNYSVVGFILIGFFMVFPKVAWQLGITLTFAHTAIDLIRDFYPDTNFWSPFTTHFFWVFLMTTIVALLVSFFAKRENSIGNLFLLLIWSCLAVSMIRMFIHPEYFNLSGLSFCKVACGRFFVDIFFAVSASALTFFVLQKFRAEVHKS